jgi:putative transposase
VVTVLDQLVAIHGAPRRIRCANGPEFISETLRAWCERHGITLVFIQPGNPNQNAYIERFNRTYRTEILNAWVVTTLDEVRDLSEAWRQRTARSGRMTLSATVPPVTFLPRATPADLSHFQLCA